MAKRKIRSNINLYQLKIGCKHFILSAGKNFNVENKNLIKVLNTKSFKTNKGVVPINILFTIKRNSFRISTF